MPAASSSRTRKARKLFWFSNHRSRSSSYTATTCCEIQSMYSKIVPDISSMTAYLVCSDVSIRRTSPKTNSFISFWPSR